MFSGDAGVSPAKTLGLEKRQCPGAVIVQAFLNLPSPMALFDTGSKRGLAWR